MKILLGYDATAAGEEGLQLALKQAQAFNADVVILTSVMVGDKGHAFGSNVVKDAEQKHSEVKNFFKENGISCVTEIQAKGKKPGEDIVSYAKENQIDLIIIGVRIRSRVGKLLIGSTAQSVILEAPCPVLTFKRENV